MLTPDQDRLRVAGGPPGLETLGDAAQAAAQAAWTGGATREAGWSFEPLEGLRQRVGVFGLRTDTSSGTDDDGLLPALVRQGAVAMERAALAAAAAENAALRQADALRSALLNSVSHDFRTPLSTVLGASTTLLDYEAELKPAVRRDLLQSIAEEARRLNRYIRDLLDMSRLEGGALTPRRQKVELQAVVESALARLGDLLGQRQITCEVAPGLHMADVDPVLLEQALLNIVENAAVYSPPTSTIRIAVVELADAVALTVEDEGPGIPPGALDKVFDRFHRAQRTVEPRAGLGLGLSIARGFVEAVGGRIAAESPIAEGRGARFRITLLKPRP